MSGGTAHPDSNSGKQTRPAWSLERPDHRVSAWSKATWVRGFLARPGHVRNHWRRTWGRNGKTAWAYFTTKEAGQKSRIDTCNFQAWIKPKQGFEESPEVKQSPFLTRSLKFEELKDSVSKINLLNAQFFFQMKNGRIKYQS